MYTTASKRNLALTKSTGQKVHSLNTVNSTNMQLQTASNMHTHAKKELNIHILPDKLRLCYIALIFEMLILNLMVN